MKRKSRTKRIYLNESIVVFAGILIACSMITFAIVNRVISDVDLFNRAEIVGIKIRKNTIKLNRLYKIIHGQVERAIKIENEIINIYEYWGRFGG